MVRKLFRKISREIFLQQKTIYRVAKSYTNKRSILFIIGCQRSGTSLMVRIFENDLNTKTYGEFSKLSSKDVSNGIRLNRVDLVNKEIQKNRAPFIILKPLVESQNIVHLLEYFKEGKALWMYRNYKDTASSDLERFGIKNGIDNLSPIVDNTPENWRSDKVSENTRKIILKYFHENMNPSDAAVLFWYARNILFFELGLDQNPNVLMCKYEELIRFPVKVVSTIYGILGQNYPGDKIVTKVHSRSINKGKNIQLSPEIDHLAKELLDKLDKAQRNKP